MSSVAPVESLRGSSVPKYMSVARHMLRAIASSKLKNGDRIGTELELAQQYQVSRLTVRSALHLLHREGFVSRKKAVGTLVDRVPTDADFAGGLHGTIAVLCDDACSFDSAEHLGLADLLCAVQSRLTTTGFVVQFIQFDRNDGSLQQQLSHIAAMRELRGICLIGPCDSAGIAERASAPALLCGACLPGQLPAVLWDLQTAGREMAGYLIERGHRDIALLCSAGANRAELALLVEGFKMAHRLAGLPFLRNRICQAFPEESVTELACELLRVSGGASAIIVDCENCEAVFSAAARLRLRVPQDVSIVIHTRHRPYIFSPGRVTSYLWDHAAMAQQATDLLVELALGRQHTPSQVLMPGRLIEGSTTAART